MVDPVHALLIFFSITLALALCFWPRWGLVPRIVRVVRVTERVRIEDALKHLYNSEYHGTPCTIESLAGALEVTRMGATRLVSRLQDLGYAETGQGGFPLTASGREYSLRVLRAHRLVERYLADRTGVAPAEWHEEAEIREHLMTSDEADTLAARLGHPRFDPHGDPIPTREGELPPPAGVPITAMEPGRTAEIVHVEDEPRQVFDAITRAGIAPLMRVLVLEPVAGRFRFRAGGREHALEPIVASAITVVPAPDAQVAEHEPETLASLRPGEEGVVTRLRRTIQGPQRRRLLDLGVVPGTRIRAELASAGGDPVGYRIRGALIALRRQQASWVEISRDLEAPVPLMDVDRPPRSARA